MSDQQTNSSSSEEGAGRVLLNEDTRALVFGWVLGQLFGWGSLVLLRSLEVAFMWSSVIACFFAVVGTVVGNAVIYLPEWGKNKP